MAKRLDLPSTLVEETPIIAQAQNQQAKPKEVLTWIANEANPNFGWHVPTSLLKAQGYDKRWKECWLPKASYMSKSPQASKHHTIKAPQPFHHSPKNPAYKWSPK